MFVLIFINLFQYLAFCTAINDIPDINDMFLTLHDDFATKVTPPKGVIIKNISIDVEKLDMNKFRDKIDYFAEKLIGKDIQDEPKFINETRRLAWTGTKVEWEYAESLLVKLKILDLMLQTIYMSRYKVKQLENDPYFNPNDTSYRIGFLYRKLRRIWKKMLDLYSTIEENYYKGRFKKVEPYIILHTKASKLHVDFLYLWWVMIRMHEKYEIRNYIPNTRPTTKRH